MSMSRRMRDDYRHFHTIITRWMDNDVYGYVNNIVYYGYLDTVADTYLIEQGVLNPEHNNIIDLIIETRCNYLVSSSSPDPVAAGLCVTRLGNTSVHYEAGLLRGDTREAATQGHFVHVYVDHETRRSVVLLDMLRAVLGSLASNITA